MARESITTGASAGNKRRAAQQFGRRLNEDEVLAKSHIKHGEEVLTVTFGFDGLPVSGVDELIGRIPANSQVISARLQATIAFVGGTSYTVGLEEPDGTVVDADGLITAANAPIAALDAIGEVVDGTGALVGAATPSTVATQVVVIAAGTFTAGEATLEVVYKPIVDRRDQFNDDL